MFEEILPFILVHWPFIAAMLFFAILMQTVKGTLYTKDNIIKYKRSRPWLGELLWWMRKTLPIHPAIFGWFVGYIPGIPASPTVETIAAKCAYFMFAGILSTWAFSLIKGLAKKRGIELEVFKADSIPPAE